MNKSEWTDISLSNLPLSIVEQAPADGCKVTLLLKVSTERATYNFQSMRLTDEETKTVPGKQLFYISGTASIDSHGRVVYLRDIHQQTVRLLTNIEALLKAGGAGMSVVRYFVVYLRDASDYEQTEAFMQQYLPHIPHVIVCARVCRPEWLIEMECVAETEKRNNIN